MLDFARVPRLRLIGLAAALGILVVYSMGGGVSVPPASAAAGNSAATATTAATVASSGRQTPADVAVTAARQQTGASGAATPANGHTGTAAGKTTGHAVAPVAQLYFEPNVGQTDARVRYFARTKAYSLYLTDQGEVVSIESSDIRPKSSHRDATFGVLRPAAWTSDMNQRPSPRASAVRIGFVGARPNPQIEGIDQLHGRVNYLVGERAHWHTGVPTYAKVRYRSIYPGVDAVYYGNRSLVEFDIRVAPGADPGVVQLSLEGADNVSLKRNGDLRLTTAAGDLDVRTPTIYEENSNGMRQPIDGHFIVLSRSIASGATTVGFALGRHDSNRTIVIDPVQIVYSSYLGGDGNNSGGLQGLQLFTDVQKELTVSDLALDVAAGPGSSVFVAGVAYSTDFPTDSALQGSNRGAGNETPNAFIAKFDTSSGDLDYATFYGGSGEPSGGSDGDQAASIAVDGAGDAYVVGTTYSTNLTTLNTLPGGNAKDGSNGPKPAPVNNGFALELNPSGGDLIYSTYIHGASGVVPSRVRIVPGCASSCEAYIDGSTRSNATVSTGTGKKKVTSNDFPILNGFQITNPDKTKNSAAFLLVLSGTNGSSPVSVVYGTFLGGGGIVIGGDAASGLVVDANGRAYMTGITFSGGKTPFPTTSGAFQKVNNAQKTLLTNAFVSVIDPSKSGASSLVWSTYLGGAGDKAEKEGDLGTGIGVDNSGNVWVDGIAFSYDAAKPGFPTTAGAFQTDNNASAAARKALTKQFKDPLLGGASNMFLSEFNSSGTLLYSTYIGGSGSSILPTNNPKLQLPIGDAATGLTVDSNGKVWVAGAISSVIPASDSGDPFPAPASPTGCYQISDTGNVGVQNGQIFPFLSAVVFEFNRSISFETLLPGSFVDVPAGISAGGTGDIVIAGLSFSGDYPITFDASQPNNNAFENGKGFFQGTTNAFVTEVNPAGTDCTNIEDYVAPLG